MDKKPPTNDVKTGQTTENAFAPRSAAGQRLDSVVAALYPDYSRSRLQLWINDGFLTVDGKLRRPKDKLVGGEKLALTLPQEQLVDIGGDFQIDNAENVRAEHLNIEVIHSDVHFYVINKPAGLVMHPAPGNRNGTLMNGLLHLDPALSAIPRAGIVHRLDKDTSGVCVVARSLKAHLSFVRQLQSRKMGRQYLAVVAGQPQDSGEIVEPIGRHPRDRKRMAVVAGGKPALTRFEVEHRFDGGAVLAVELSSGRTHQIRVHMTHLGHPLLGDPVYQQKTVSQKSREWLARTWPSWNRQALHAQHLQLIHPETAEPCSFKQAPPTDMQNLIDALPPLVTSDYE
jgi:23S rRNA pseudouridine1911/1915/1917 synthase